MNFFKKEKHAIKKNQNNIFFFSKITQNYVIWDFFITFLFDNIFYLPSTFIICAAFEPIKRKFLLRKYKKRFR